MKENIVQSFIVIIGKCISLSDDIVDVLLPSKIIIE
jgi:hypothetical protein